MSGTDNPIADQSEKLPKPEELAGASFDKPSVLSPALKNEKETVAPTSADMQAGPKDRFQFGSFVHDYVRAHILLAEQKAAFVFAADIAFVSYLVTTIPSDFVHTPRLQQGLIISALLFLLFSLGAVIAVVTPQLGGDLRGLIYFKAISNRPTAGDYTADVLRANQPELDTAITQHIYEMAGICARKFGRVRWAILLGLCGFATGLAWLALLHTATTHNEHFSIDFFPL
jgi:hypothetical protein